MTQVRICNGTMELGQSGVGELRDSSDLRTNAAALRSRLAEDGYLLIRGLQPVERVRTARRFLLEKLAENGQIDTRHPLDEARAAEGARGGFHGGSKPLTRDPAFLGLVESPEVFAFFSDLYGAPVLTYDFKWLRVVAPGDFSGAHYDICYMGRGTQDVLTCWTPLGDVPLESGPLAVLVGSHRGEGFERIRQTYGRMDVDRDHVTGAFSNDPYEMVERYGGRWATAEFRAGDVLLFGMYTMHASVVNTSDCFRLSTDTRFQRADEPVDERWMGADPIAHYAWTVGKTVSMEEARAEWNV